METNNQCWQCKRWVPVSQLKAYDDWSWRPGYFYCPECYDKLLDSARRICGICEDQFLSTEMIWRYPYTAFCIPCREKYHLWLYMGAISAAKSRANQFGLECDLKLSEWATTLAHFGNACAYCGNQQDQIFTIEHFVPLALGGGTTRHNCVPACMDCNMRKHDFHPDDPRHGISMEHIEVMKDYLASL